jgi:hypothetical protein
MKNEIVKPKRNKNKIAKKRKAQPKKEEKIVS